MSLVVLIIAEIFAISLYCYVRGHSLEETLSRIYFTTVGILMGWYNK